MASGLAMLSVSKSSTLSNIPDQIILHPNSLITIGRGSKCDMRFPDNKSVSHVHCYVRSQDGVVQLKSVSSNKTLFNSVVLPDNEWHTVRNSGALLLSSDSKLKIDVRVGDEALNRKKHKQKLIGRNSHGIAEVSGLKDPRVHAIVVPTEEDTVCLTVGRSKDCDIVIDNKKISSLHCKLIWTLVSEGQYTLTIIPGESRNKTFLNSEEIKESLTFPFSTTPVDICLVFPGSDKAVEILHISACSAPDREDKRRKKELRTLEKDDRKWNQSFNEDVNLLVEQESTLLRDIELAESQLVDKNAQVAELKKCVSNIESRMHSDSGLLEEARKVHESKFKLLTLNLNETIARLSQLTQTKNDLLMEQP